MTYYEILQLQPTTTPQEILSSYRRLALKTHPSRNKDSPTLPFQNITAAYQILSNPELKARFDRFGEIFKFQENDGKLSTSGENFPPLSTSLTIFEQIFGSSDPFSCDYDVGISDFGAFPGADERNWRPRVKRSEKDGDIFVDLKLNLEELYFGCVKKRKILKRILNADSTFYEKPEIVEIQVQKGWKQNTEIRFRELGNEAFGIVPSDVIFIIQEEQHEIFKRNGDDLMIQLKISLAEALCGFSSEIKTLDGRALHVECNEVIQSGGIKVVHGEGMPKINGGFGDLKIEFIVEFPKHIPEEMKGVIKGVLEQVE
ncbi:Chaperone protein DnaJ subfamily B [Spironucleus salmonicida]|uniref:Chaperone protein DnaJ n=1 Tax=Spironucleus salmonicida TaxID=348837 RepID=V6LG16_9EUKA|nr:Chaperone protein DnaJ subfamily B [Spironucleus salmonicida]|eukprot:EST43213.1 Chaperone protein DnaJ [Spironucleus salmonicida]